MKDEQPTPIIDRLSPAERARYESAVMDLHAMMRRCPRVERMYQAFVSPENSVELHFARRPTRTELDTLIAQIQVWQQALSPESERPE